MTTVNGAMLHRVAADGVSHALAAVAFLVGLGGVLFDAGWLQATYGVTFEKLVMKIRLVQPISVGGETEFAFAGPGNIGLWIVGRVIDLTIWITLLGVFPNLRRTVAELISGTVVLKQTEEWEQIVKPEHHKREI